MQMAYIELCLRSGTLILCTYIKLHMHGLLDTLIFFLMQEFVCLKFLWDFCDVLTFVFVKIMLINFYIIFCIGYIVIFLSIHTIQ
jgi:hypothetical protein